MSRTRGMAGNVISAKWKKRGLTRGRSNRRACPAPCDLDWHHRCGASAADGFQLLGTVDRLLGLALAEIVDRYLSSCRGRLAGEALSINRALGPATAMESAVDWVRADARRSMSGRAESNQRPDFAQEKESFCSLNLDQVRSTATWGGIEKPAAGRATTRFLPPSISRGTPWGTPNRRLRPRATARPILSLPGFLQRPGALILATRPPTELP